MKKRVQKAIVRTCALLGLSGFFGDSVQTKKVIDPNESINVPVELRLKRIPKNVFYDPNRPSRCLAYSCSVAKSFGLNYSRSGAAWDFSKSNKVVFVSSFDRNNYCGEIQKEKLSEMIAKGKVVPGTIIGIFYSESKHNKPDRQFTHTMVYMGNNLFRHNFFGPNEISLNQIYSMSGNEGKRIFYPVMVLIPKEK
ncbi:MAG: hypothetical protein ABIA76_03235 [Candidatus Diapherotrites archaeon]